MPSSSPSPLAGEVTSGFRSPPPVKYNDPNAPLSQSLYVSPNVGPYQRFLTPNSMTAQPQSPSYGPPSAEQPMLQPSVLPTPFQQGPSLAFYQHQPPSYGPPSAGQPMLLPSVLPPSRQQGPSSASYNPQPQVPLMPMGPPVSLPENSFQSGLDSSVSALKTVPWPFSQGYAPGYTNLVTQTSPFLTPSIYNDQGGFAQAPPFASQPVQNLREQLQYPGGGHPITSVNQSLVEEFSSLSVGSISGSIDPGIDFKALPRPLDGVVDPKSSIEMFPLNCHPRYLILTTSSIPNSQSLLSRWHLPLGAVIHPLAEAPEGEEVPIISSGQSTVIRCRRCRTYVNPYVVFLDGGRRWRCNICGLPNEVPGEYFAHVDNTGRRVDMDQRPELTRGTVEFVAPAEYMMRPPMPPSYFFLIDVSLTAVKSGMIEIVAKTIKSCLDDLHGNSRTQIGFITFDSTLHFYNLKSSLTQPQMMVVSDINDIFIPLPEDLLVNLSESRTVVDAFLDSLPSMFQDNVNLESAFGTALKASLMVMSQLGGKLLIFLTALPSVGSGRLRTRGDDLRVYGTDKEHTLRIPEDPFYKQMAADLTKFQIGVNVYAFNNRYIDLASIGTLAKYTGGQVYHYPQFQRDIHEKKLTYELSRDLKRETAWEAVMRIRCGKGLRCTSYNGHFMLKSTDLLAVPVVDCDKAFAMQFSLEDTLLTSQTVFFQVTLLYTSSCGERRIRVHTAAAPVVTDLGDMYRHADIGAVVSLLSRAAIERTLTDKLEDVRQFVLLRTLKALKEYRNLYSVQHRLGPRMIYPESLKFLYVYSLAICKSIPVRGGNADVLLDERCASGYTMMTLPVRRLLKLLYPNLIRIDEYLVKTLSTSEDFRSLKKMPLAAENFDSKGLYLYDDGFRFILWFGAMLSPVIASSLLGTDLSGFPDFSKVNILELDNEVSRKLIRLLNTFRNSDHSCYQLCHIIRQGEKPREVSLLLTNLVEDQTSGTSGYVDWILNIHRQIQQTA